MRIKKEKKRKGMRLLGRNGEGRIGGGGVGTAEARFWPPLCTRDKVGNGNGKPDPKARIFVLNLITVLIIISWNFFKNF